MVVQPRVILEQAAWHVVMEEQAVDRVEEKQEEGGVVEKEDWDGLEMERAEVEDLSGHVVDHS